MTPLREEKPLWTYPDSASVFEASGLPGNSSCSGRKAFPGGKAELSVPRTTEFSVLFCSVSGLFCDWN